MISSLRVAFGGLFKFSIGYFFFSKLEKTNNPLNNTTMTKRQVINKYFPQLIMSMENPEKALGYVEPWSKGLPLRKIVDNLPEGLIPALFNIIKASKYRTDPKPILDMPNKELKEATS